MIHLDTSFLIHALVPSSQGDRRLRAWLRAGDDISMSSIAWAGFLCGPVRTQDIAAVRDVLRAIAAYTDADADITARLFNAGGRRQGTLADCMIAAAAIRAGASLATTHPSDFAQFRAHSLTIVDL